MPEVKWSFRLGNVQVAWQKYSNKPFLVFYNEQDWQGMVFFKLNIVIYKREK